MQHLLSNWGYAAIVFLAFVEAACVPLPSEVTFGFAGVLASQGKFNLALVVLLGSIAELAGCYVAYAVGRVGGRPLIRRLGKYVLLSNKDLDRAETWLSGRGEVWVAVGRAMPVLRGFTSLVAGTAEMPAVRFGIFSLIGTLVYASALSGIGYGVGSAWQRVEHDFSIAGYVIVALVVVVIAAFVAYRVRQLRHERTELALADTSKRRARRRPLPDDRTAGERQREVG